MHIIKKGDLKNHILIDHTLIIKEIERSIKFYNWDFILSSLPSGSFLVGGYTVSYTHLTLPTNREV